MANQQTLSADAVRQLQQSYGSRVQSMEAESANVVHHVIAQANSVNALLEEERRKSLALEARLKDMEAANYSSGLSQAALANQVHTLYKEAQTDLNLGTSIQHGEFLS